MFFTNKMPRVDFVGEQYVTPEKRGFGWTFRPYEYFFTISHLDYKHDLIADCGCGYNYPLKKHIAVMSDNIVYAVDVDDRILTEVPFSNLINKVASISKLPFDDNSLTCIICVSVLEHVSPFTLNSFVSECRRVLRRGGKIILTVDFPRINIEALHYLFLSYGFISKFKLSFTLPSNLVSFYHPGFKKYLFCWGAVLINY